MSQASDGFELRDGLLALPLLFLLLIACIPLVAASLGVLLIFSTESDSVRTAGILLITLSAPALAVAVGLVAAVRVRTDDIDRLVRTWLTTTVQEKLSSYLVGAGGSRAPRLYPPLFREVQAFPETSSFCLFEITDFEDEPHFLYVKSNIFNVEIGIFLALTSGARAIPEVPVHLTDLGSLAACDDPRVRCVADTLHGAISEGYGIYISNGRNSDGDYVTYRLRQKLEAQFITSPYTRRYFAEDIAIAAYWLYSEVRSADGVAISGSRGPLVPHEVVPSP